MFKQVEICIIYSPCPKGFSGHVIPGGKNIGHSTILNKMAIWKFLMNISERLWVVWVTNKSELKGVSYPPIIFESYRQ